MLNKIPVSIHCEGQLRSEFPRSKSQRQCVWPVAGCNEPAGQRWHSPDEFAKLWASHATQLDVLEARQVPNGQGRQMPVPFWNLPAGHQGHSSILKCLKYLINSDQNGPKGIEHTEVSWSSLTMTKYLRYGPNVTKWMNAKSSTLPLPKSQHKRLFDTSLFWFTVFVLRKLTDVSSTKSHYIQSFIRASTRPRSPGNPPRPAPHGSQSEISNGRDQVARKRPSWHNLQATGKVQLFTAA